MTTSERGLQAERTALAWWRTAIGAMANALLFLHVALVSDRPSAIALPFAAVAALIVVAVIALRRSRFLHSHHRSQWHEARFAVAVVTVAIVAVACTAIVLGFE
ncbi:DUF202 domain-containing protein [Nocardia transvalensis]|uniref:DUF202 domain-containing protein n=1 Tax=Nocardia transvalensis TaxID=37333 RepID=UPI001894F325|nr:DUF202 domain-containing protein [Nocardia transvalensis]MBF6329367.1 DUF202 domain-containing protein [Nocardia transvalensis]